MTYAIIGSGAIGSAIATHFARAALDVHVANSRGPATIAPLAARLGGYIKPAAVEDALKADVVFLAIPFHAVLPAVLDAGDWNGRIVVDATNAIEFPSFKPLDLGGRPSSQLIAETVPGSRVVKAFNTLPAAILASDPRSDGGRRVLFVSGDHADANQTIAALIADLGFSPLVLGALHEGGRLQQFGAALVAQNLSRHG
jgi:predicted dinucleotide-binding enzyme